MPAAASGKEGNLFAGQVVEGCERLLRLVEPEGGQGGANFFVRRGGIEQQIYLARRGWVFGESRGEQSFQHLPRGLKPPLQFDAQLRGLTWQIKIGGKMPGERLIDRNWDRL